MINMQRKRNLPSWLLTVARAAEDSKSEKNEKIVESDSSKKECSSSIPLQKILHERLPLLTYGGKLHCYNNIPDTSIACEGILEKLNVKEEIVVGMDMEWDVSYQSGKENKTALLQLCTSQNDCYIFHLASMTGFPKELRRLIEHPLVKKVGVGVVSDLWKLERDFHFSVENSVKSSCIDLKQMACDVLQKGGEQWSLDGLLAFLLNHRLQKDPAVRKSKWSRWPLSDVQVKYAALDAYASLVVYKKLHELQEDLQICNNL